MGFSPQNTSSQQTAQHRLEAQKLHTELFTANLQAHLQSTSGFAQAATRWAFILNGAAAIAGFTAFSAIGKDVAISIITSGAWGALCAVICAGFSYLSQRVYMAADIHSCHSWFTKALSVSVPPARWHSKYRTGNIFTACAVICFVASLYFFIDGLLHLPEVFAKIGK